MLPAAPPFAISSKHFSMADRESLPRSSAVKSPASPGTVYRLACSIHKRKCSKGELTIMITKFARRLTAPLAFFFACCAKATFLRICAWLTVIALRQGFLPRSGTTSGQLPFSPRSRCLSSRCCFLRGIPRPSAPPLSGAPPTPIQEAPSRTQFLRRSSMLLLPLPSSKSSPVLRFLPGRSASPSFS